MEAMLGYLVPSCSHILVRYVVMGAASKKHLTYKGHDVQDCACKFTSLGGELIAKTQRFCSTDIMIK
eukprot:4973154-Pyramimonas_sp.AAC.1